MAKGVRLLEKILDQKPFSIEATESTILDLRGVKGFKIFLNGGTATIREVDESGANVPGSSDA
ncbi:MAG: hypothetical protein J5I35_03965, partial [Methanothrix harundinacea]|nr:hypothetical protein [Methanothrix harundinacea]